MAGGAFTSTPSEGVQLHALSPRVQRLEPSTSIVVNLPDATQLPLRAGGPVFVITNAGSYFIRLQNFLGDFVTVIDPGCTVSVLLSDHTTSAGVWHAHETCLEGVTTTTTTTTTTTSTTTTTTTSTTTTSTTTTTTTTTTVCGGDAPNPETGCMCAGFEYNYTMGTYDAGLANCEDCDLPCPQPDETYCCLITKYLDTWSSSCSGVSVIDEGNGNIRIIVPPGSSGCTICINVGYASGWQSPCEGGPFSNWVPCCTKIYNLCWTVC